MARRKIGIWLIGAKGGVATTVTVGLVALKKGMCGPVGLVTHLPLFEGLDLPEYGDMVIGGHDIRTTTLYAEAQQLASNNHALDDRSSIASRASLTKSTRTTAAARS